MCAYIETGKRARQTRAVACLSARVCERVCEFFLCAQRVHCTEFHESAMQNYLYGQCADMATWRRPACTRTLCPGITPDSDCMWKNCSKEYDKKYVSVYVNNYIYTYMICVYKYKYTYLLMCASYEYTIFMYVYIINMYTQVYIYMYTYIYICTYIHMYACVYVYI